MEYASVPAVLHRLGKATGLAFTISERLQGLGELGRVQTERAQAWAVTEWLASKHSRPARWERTAGGYRLVPAAPLGLVFPWVVGGVILAGFAISAAVVRTR